MGNMRCKGPDRGQQNLARICSGQSDNTEEQWLEMRWAGGQRSDRAASPSSRQRNKGEHWKAWGLAVTALSLPFSAQDSFPSCSPSLKSLSPLGTCSQDYPKRKCWEGLTGRSQVNPLVTRMRTAPIETAQPALGRVEPDILDFSGQEAPAVSPGALAAGEKGEPQTPRRREDGKQWQRGREKKL